jgi:hypothetical protein
MSNPYAYEHLEDPVNFVDSAGRSAVSVRLLDILPGDKTDDIECELRCVTLGNGVDYEALSYTWGSPDRVYRIRCGAGFLMVTATLKEALEALRDPKRTRTMWIDQLCINQEDIRERNSQVKNMHHVYQYATRTVVFLGSVEHEAPSQLVSMTLWKQYYHAWKSRKAKSNIFEEYERLFSHPWFRRVWILQEVGLSDYDKLVVCYNGSVQSWRELSLAATLVDSCSSDTRLELLQLPPSPSRHAMVIGKWTTMDSSASQFPNISRYGRVKGIEDRLYTRCLWKRDLTERLQDSRFCEATDPRDKVFSLLNLLPNLDGNLAWLLEVDYLLPVATVFTRAARYSIETLCSLEVLCYKEGRIGTTGLPSWVPDWTRQSLFPIHRLSLIHHYRSQFHPDAPISMYKYSGPRWRNTTPVASFNDQSNAIMLSGYKLDTIANVSSIWEKPLEAADTDIFEQWAAIFTGGKASELTDLPYKAERRGKGLRTTPYSIVDFWVRVTRSPRFKTTDTLDPFTTDHPAQKQWRSSTYRRHRKRGRGMILSRKGLHSLIMWYSWLALMLPYASVGRRVAATRDGYFLLVPPETRPGDQMYFLKGGGWLGYVLRKREGGDTIEFVGAAYVHGFFGIQPNWEGRVVENIRID